MKTQTRIARIFFATIFCAAVTGGFLGCKGDPGTNGTNGVDGLSKAPKDTGTISGRVLISGTTSPAAQVKVVANPGAVSKGAIAAVHTQLLPSVVRRAIPAAIGRLVPDWPRFARLDGYTPSPAFAIFSTLRSQSSMSRSEGSTSTWSAPASR